MFLKIAQIGAVLGAGPFHPAIAGEPPSDGAVVEREVEQFADLGDVASVGDADQYLHATVEVAVHEVGRAESDDRIAAVLEPVKP